MEVPAKTNYALVAGGSKGIGFAIAEALARRKYNLVLIGRNQDSLEHARDELIEKYQIEVEILVKDLSSQESADEIADWCFSRRVSLKILCNVSGIGGAQDYLLSSLDNLRSMITINIESPMALTLKLLPLLKENLPAYILNVGSMAGFAPIPVKNLYSATKSAILFFSYSLHYQLKKENINVSCLCPGPVFTKPEIIKDTKEKLGRFGTMLAIEPKRVGEIAIRDTLKGKLVIVPGVLPKIMSIFLRLLPKRWLLYIYYKLGKN